MHESAARLYLAAKEMRGVEGQTQVATLIGAETPQTVNNWETRGVSKDGALLAQDTIGCDAIWLLTGRGSMQPGWPFSIAFGRFKALNERQQGIVEGRLIAAIEECEAQQPTKEVGWVMKTVALTATPKEVAARKRG